METNTKFKTIDMAVIAMFCALIAVCAWISIPATVPFTLQTFAIFLAVGVLGGKKGTIAVLVYLVLGIIGAPVFAGFKGGIGTLFGSTGGYIAGFLLAALTMWAFEKIPCKKRWIILILSMIAGLCVCYAFGTAWFIKVYSAEKSPIGLKTALMWCVVPYIIPDLVKISLAFVLSGRISKLIKKIAK